MSGNTTQQLVEIQNEQRAQKVAIKLNYGQLSQPGTAPTATYSGTVTNSVQPFGGSARWIATFTRTDDVELPPVVDFAWDKTLGLYTYTDLISAGFIDSASGRDRQAIDELAWSDGLWEIGSNYVKWRIDIGGNNGSWFYVSSDGTTVNLTVQAVSPVPGTLNLVRLA